MSIVNQTIPRALTVSVYAPDRSEEHRQLHQRKHVGSSCAPHVAPEHLPSSPVPWVTTHPLSGPRPHDGWPFNRYLGGPLECVVGETLLATADGLVRIGSLHQGENPTASGTGLWLGIAPTGIHRPMPSTTAASGPCTSDAAVPGTPCGTPNHRVLVAGDRRPRLERLDRDRYRRPRGNEVLATTSGRPSCPRSMTSSRRRPTDRRSDRIPQEMSEPLAFFLVPMRQRPHEPLDVDP